MIRRTLFLMALLIILTLLSGCDLLPATGSRAPAQQEATPTPIPTPIVPIKPSYHVQRGEVVHLVEFSGRIAPMIEEKLFFRTDGQVRKVYIKKDDLVTAGQVLADLEIDDLERELASAQLELERARVRLSAAERELAHNIRRTEVNLQIAQLNLEALQVQDLTPRQLQAAADLEKTHIVLQQAQADYDEIAWRNDRVASEQAAALQQATLDYTQAKATYDLALQDIAGHQYEVAIKEREVELAQIALDELNEGVDPLLENDVQRASLDVQKLQANISDAQLTAPFDGQVLSFGVTAGRAATAYNEVALVADLSELEVSADLTSSVLEDLAEGMPVTMVASNRPGEQLEGHIRSLPYPYGGRGRTSPEFEEDDQDKSTRISVTTNITEAGFELGDLVRVTAVVERKENVLWLPPQAIRTFEGRKFVVVQDGEIQRRVDVQVGIEGEEQIEIESGLTEGQLVIGE